MLCMGCCALHVERLVKAGLLLLTLILAAVVRSHSLKVQRKIAACSKVQRSLSLYIPAVENVYLFTSEDSFYNVKQKQRFASTSLSFTLFNGRWHILETRFYKSLIRSIRCNVSTIQISANSKKKNQHLVLTIQHFRLYRLRASSIPRFSRSSLMRKTVALCAHVHYCSETMTAQRELQLIHTVRPCVPAWARSPPRWT